MSALLRASRAELAAVAVSLATAALSPACATLGATDDSGGGALDLPSAGVGPFRRVADDEVRGVAPFVLEDREARFREPAAVDTASGVVLFAVASDASNAEPDGAARDVIVRTRATDGRSFFGTTGDDGRRPPVVLAPALPWEGPKLGRPSVVRRGEEWLLYYACASGIGLARSRDGLAFTREPDPVLSEAGPRGAWETTPPRAPGAYLLPDGRVRLLYAAGLSIGEAESDDGVVFRRRDGDPGTPELDPALGPEGSSASFDGARVSDPAPLPRVTPVGRTVLRVLYTGEDAAGASAIGFAARFGDDGPLVRQPLPVYAVGQHERAPSVIEGAGGLTLLYVGQERRVDAARVFPGIACAVAPGGVRLPPPDPFPDGP